MFSPYLGPRKWDLAWSLESSRIWKTNTKGDFSIERERNTIVRREKGRLVERSVVWDGGQAEVSQPTEMEELLKTESLRAPNAN